MSLHYNVLWVDDEKEKFENLGYHNEISEYVKDLFFEPTVDLCDSVDEALEKTKSTKYDIIFSDYNIGEKEKGDVFIKTIRKSNINCEILFYSAQQDLPNILQDGNSVPLNRISFMRLEPNGYANMIATMKSTIDLTVEKLQNISAIRGFVMAEVSDLDVKMANIIKIFFADGTSGKKTKFDKHIVKPIEKNIKLMLEQTECLELINNNTQKKIKTTPCKHKWRNIPIGEIISNVDFESSHKARTINLIIKEIGYPYKYKDKNFFEDYKKDIIANRNNLAHCTSFFQDGIEVLKTKEGDKTFSKEDFSKIRKSILEYNDLFEKILISINNNRI